MTRLRRGNFSAPPRYCLYDFSLSVIFPSDLPPEQCLLLSEVSFQGFRWYGPPDVFRGEIVYDPFAYDVACMGNMLKSSFEVCDILLITPIN